MSIQTTMARAAARGSGAEWAHHRKGCQPCRLGALHQCDTGRELGAAAVADARRVAAELAADRAAVALGQGTLFGQESLFAGAGS